MVLTLSMLEVLPVPVLYEQSYTYDYCTEGSMEKTEMPRIVHVHSYSLVTITPWEQPLTHS